MGWRLRLKQQATAKMQKKTIHGGGEFKTVSGSCPAASLSVFESIAIDLLTTG